MAPRKKPSVASRRKVAASKRRAVARPRAKSPAPEAPAEGAGQTLPVDVQPGKVEEALKKVTEQLRHWANTGRYTKVRFKFRGKPLLPDLPLAAVVAAEGLTFYWTGILRALLVNVAGRSVFDVELVNDSASHVQKGKEELLAGEVDKAIAEFRVAVSKQRDNPSGHLNLGVALKLKGDRSGARAALEKARELDPEGAVGKEAERLLQGLGTPSDVGGGGF